MAKNFDERDTIFSRMFELQKGSQKYDTYYMNNPDKKESDESLRHHQEGLYADDVLSHKLVDSTFHFLKDIRPLAHKNNKSSEIIHVDTDELTALLKELAADYGAVLSGAALMKPEFYYSHRGRGDKYGEAVTENCKYIFVYAVKMNKDELLNAPGPKSTREVVRGYSRVALIGMIISYYIQSLGWDAYCHMDGETTIPMVPAAYEAGLGEIGRIGILINKEYGASIRLGAVTTNIPLTPDGPKPFGLKKICRTCKKCSSNCPGNAIDTKTEEPWKETCDTRCFSMWNKYGTDCGICLISCPFSR